MATEELANEESPIDARIESAYESVVVGAEPDTEADTRRGGEPLELLLTLALFTAQVNKSSSEDFCCCCCCNGPGCRCIDLCRCGEAGDGEIESGGGRARRGDRGGGGVRVGIEFDVGVEIEFGAGVICIDS